MNRIIKFRAWDKKNKKWVRDLETADSDNEGSGAFIAGHFIYPSFWELMQFTGLTDKNGKEIYEGDIVKGNYIHKVEFFECCFQIWREKNGEGNNYQHLYPIGERLEVIGNIYENPELIKR